MRRLMYFLREGFRQFVRSPSLSASAIVAMTASLAVLGLFAVASRNLGTVLEGVERRKEMSVFLKNGLTDDQRRDVETRLRRISGVAGVRYVSPDEAWDRFEQEMGETGLLDVLGANPLPGSYEIDLAPTSRTYGAMERISQEAGVIEGVDDTVFGGEWVRRLDRLLSAVRVGNALAGFLVGLSVIFIISHTIRLTVLAKRDLIEILRVVGASRTFVRLPFVIEGALQSTAAGLIALGLLGIAYRAAVPRLPGLLYLSPSQAGTFLVFAALMGCIGSFIAVRGSGRVIDNPRGGVLGSIALAVGLAAAATGGLSHAWAFAPAPAPAGAPAKGPGGAGSGAAARSSGGTAAPRAATGATTPRAAADTTADDSSSEIINRSKELEQIRKEIAENRKKIDVLSRQEKDNLRSLRAVEKDVGLTEKLIRKLEDQERDIETDLTHQRFLHGEVSTELTEMQQTLAGRARAIYKRGAAGELEILASSRSFRDLLVRTRFLTVLLESDRRLIEETRERRAEVAETVQSLEQRQEQVSQVRDEKVAAREALAKKKKEREGATRRVREQKESYEEAVRDLERASAEISRVIEKLEAARRQREEAARRGEKQPEPLPLFPDFARNRNRLPWPVTGQVVARFGNEKHPKFGTMIRNNGVDIAAPEGTPFRAVAAGRVEFAEWLPGYGNCIILNHGGGFYTLYAHAQDLAVAVGRDVDAGQALGHVGATDSIRGECLHFEVRKGSTPQDPLGWLR